MMLDPATQGKYERLQSLLADCGRVLVAYSGGIDSTLVAQVAFTVLGDRMVAVTAQSPSLLPEDLAAAQFQAQVIGMRHEVVTTHELENPQYAANPVNRCYFCKSELHDTLCPLTRAWGYDYLMDGLNADDLHDYRPGIQAAKERGVRSPLAEVGITKLEVRMIAQFLGMPWWNKPAQPCLSSRFPYGEAITVAKLQRVGAAESYLRQRGWQGDLRVRSQGDTAKIEVAGDRLGEFLEFCNPAELVTTLRQLGFQTITLDLEGFRSGKLNDGVRRGTPGE
jgi:uncharacterized protein